MAGEISGLANELVTPERGDLLPAVDSSENILAAKTKRARIEILAEHIGNYAQPSLAQQLLFQLAFRVVPSDVVTDIDIGGRGGGSWRLTTVTQFGNFPNRSADSNNVERRGHGVLTKIGNTYSLVLNRFSLWYSGGVSREDVDAALASLRAGDTVQLDSWTNNQGVAQITVPFLLLDVPAYATSTESYTLILGQIRTGVVITPQHQTPVGASYPYFGVSLGIRAQKSLPLSDTAPQPSAAAATAGVGSAASRDDHQHPTPGVPIATLNDAASISWNVKSAPNAQVTLTGNRTMSAPSNPQNGAYYLLSVIQDSTGSRTLTWNEAFVFTGIGFVAGDDPPISDGSGARTKFTFAYEGNKMRCLSRVVGF